MSVTAASVPTTGEKVNLTFSGSVGSVDSTLFPVVANGVPMQLAAATGSGTAWSLPLTTRSGWIPAGQTVKVTDVAGSNIVSATNSGTVTQAQQRYVNRGFGIFVHLTTMSFPGVTEPPTAPQLAALDMPSYDMEQWFTSVVVPSGARYAVFTTKHAGGFSWWPTAAGNWDIRSTAFGAAHPGADICRDFVRVCRKYNIVVGFYINFYDPWFKDIRPGHTGLYTPTADYQAYMTQQITELFSNYGKIEILWVDTLGIGSPYYTDYPWEMIQSLRNSLQPSCVLVGNNHEHSLVHTDIQLEEGSLGGGSIPASTNTVPAEFTEDSRTVDSWVWDAATGDTYKDVYLIAGKVAQCKTARCAYHLNFPINASGLMPTSTGTYATQLGSIIGKQGGNPVVPSLYNVRAGIDRGDGQTGQWGGGINSSAILGLA